MCSGSSLVLLPMYFRIPTVIQPQGLVNPQYFSFFMRFSNKTDVHHPAHDSVAIPLMNTVRDSGFDNSYDVPGGSSAPSTCGRLRGTMRYLRHFIYYDVRKVRTFCDPVRHVALRLCSIMPTIEGRGSSAFIQDCIPQAVFHSSRLQVLRDVYP